MYDNLPAGRFFIGQIGGTMLVIKKLELYMKKDLRVLLKDFNFSLNPGDKVALIGEEGNGKSTLLKAIYDANLVEDYIELKGEIFKQNEILGYLPQKLEEKISNMNVNDYIMDNKEDFDYNLFYELLKELNIEEELAYRENRISELSGGEKIKIQLLKLMLEEPTVLLLDEPSNDLDMESIIGLEQFIKNAKIPIMFVSHDEVLIEKCANTIIHIEQLMRKSEPKYTISRQTYQEYLSIRDYQISTTERIANKEREELDKKMDKYRRIYDKVERAQREVSRQDPAAGKNLKDKMHTVKSMGRRFEKEEENLTKRPDFEESISIKFGKENVLPNGKKVLEFHLDELKIEDKILSKDIYLEITGAKKICIVGENGIGKTTLIRKILGEIKDDVTHFYMSQNYVETMDSTLTPIDYLKKNETKDENTRVRTYLGSLKFTKEEMERPISELSGGQVAKLFFSNMTSGEYQVLVLDEPTRNLSPLSGPEIRNALKNFSGCVISISHDRKYLEEVVDYLYILDKDGLKEVSKEKYLEKYM